MTLFQAIMVGFCYYCYVFRAGYSLRFDQPLIIAFYVGLVMGDLPTAMKVGATVMPMFLAHGGGGGNVPADKCAAGLVPAAVVIASGMPIDQSITLAVAVALVLAQLHNLRRLVATAWVHMADKAAERCDIRGVRMAGLVYVNLAKIIMFWVPMTLMLYFGAEFIGSTLSNLPPWLSNGMTVAGKMLPAVGYAMTIRVIGRRDLLPYFIAGFFFAKYTGVSSIPLACVALFLAFMDMRFAKGRVDEAQEEGNLFQLDDEAEEEQHKRLLTKKDLNRTWLWWWFSAEQNNSFERLQALSFCITMAPILKKLYPDNPDQLRAGLKRHLLFFNTQGIWGAVVVGIVTSMEEQKAMGLPIEESAIIGIKTGLMGPFAGIGDTIDHATILPLLLAFFIPFGLEGHWWAGLAPQAIFLAITWIEGTTFFRLGYRLGTRAAMTILQSGQVQRVITFFSVLGLFMMGGLSAGVVNVQCALTIPTSGGTPMVVQTEILDKIVPGLLSILTIFGVYRYLNRGGNMLKSTLYIVVIALVLGFLGILGTPPKVA